MKIIIEKVETYKKTSFEVYVQEWHRFLFWKFKHELPIVEHSAIEGHFHEMKDVATFQMKATQYDTIEEAQAAAERFVQQEWHSQKKRKFGTIRTQIAEFKVIYSDLKDTPPRLLKIEE